MKNQISRGELVALDGLAIAVDHTQQTMAALGRGIEQLLEVEAWDYQKRSAIASFVATGGRLPLDEFLDRLGVAIDNSKGS